ncbi:MAG: hypothetical protein H6729_01175 [Deltaproteobacteria bacterium]|nr:hypothetical protein [Deltaproteobacteria bacterium]
MDIKQPEISIQDYVLARVPSADPRHFLGRRYDGTDGDMGDRPCTMGDVIEAPSQQHLVATLNQHQLFALKLLPYQVLGAGAGISLDAVEELRLELNTTRRAQSSVGDGCDDEVIFDAVGGSLHVEYRFKRQIDLTAEASKLNMSAEAGYRIEQDRNIISSTINNTEYVAFRVHHPKDNTFRNLVVTGLGVVLVGVGAITDVIFARDGKDNASEWIPVGLYAAGLGLGTYGVLTWD